MYVQIYINHLIYDIIGSTSVTSFFSKIRCRYKIEWTSIRRWPSSARWMCNGQWIIKQNAVAKGPVPTVHPAQVQIRGPRKPGDSLHTANLQTRHWWTFAQLWSPLFAKLFITEIHFKVNSYVTKLFANLTFKDLSNVTVSKLRNIFFPVFTYRKCLRSGGRCGDV